MDYEAEDKAALKRALLGLRICPLCRRDLERMPTPGKWVCEGWDAQAKEYDHDPITWMLE
jgi:hypothetical protein